jgi:hypothetical protein
VCKVQFAEINLHHLQVRTCMFSPAYAPHMHLANDTACLLVQTLCG